MCFFFLSLSLLHVFDFVSFVQFFSSPENNVRTGFICEINESLSCFLFHLFSLFLLFFRFSLIQGTPMRHVLVMSFAFRVFRRAFIANCNAQLVANPSMQSTHSFAPVLFDSKFYCFLFIALIENLAAHGKVHCMSLRIIPLPANVGPFSASSVERTVCNMLFL